MSYHRDLGNYLSRNIIKQSLQTFHLKTLTLHLFNSFVLNTYLDNPQKLHETLDKVSHQPKLIFFADKFCKG